MKRTTIYILTLFVLLMGVFLIGKIAFVLYNHDIEAVGIGGTGLVGLHGLLLDLRTSALLLLIPALCCLFIRRGLRWVLVPYLVAVGVVVGIIVAADIVMYEFWEFKLSSVHLAYAASPEGTTNSVSVGFLASRLLMVLTFILFFAVPAVWFMPKTKGKEETATRRDTTCRVRPSRKTWLPVLALLVISLLPVGVGSCYYQASLFHCHAATNPVYRFFVSFGDARRYEAKGKGLKVKGEGLKAKGEYEEEKPLAFSLSPLALEALADTLLRTPRPNVLFIMMESFGGKFVKELGGLPDVAPNLSRLIPQSIFFDQYYSSSFRTDRGTVCAYSGWIGYPTVSPMKDASMHPRLSSLPRALRANGYQTGYMYAGAMTNMGKARYLIDMGFESLLDEEYFTAEELNSSWGANDGTAARRLYETLAEITPSAQWMMVWQTLSSHEPWDVPYHRLEDKRLNAFAYTDECVGQLVDSLRTLPVWDNLLVIIIPDHGFLYEQTYDTGEFFHSPMLWTGGAIREPRVVHTLMNQSDIAATLLAQMQLPHNQFPWSRNVFAPDYEPSVYCTYPAGLFYKDATGETVYDLTADKPIPIGQPADSLRLSKALGILHRSYRELTSNEISIQ